jgi:hypothetical protein
VQQQIDESRQSWLPIAVDQISKHVYQFGTPLDRK